MRIVHINSHYDQGGAARIAACIHRELLREGQESYAVYGRGGDRQEKNVFRFDGRADIYVSALLSRVTGLNGYWNRAATRRLLHILDRVRPDILHLHALHGYYLNLEMLFGYINAHEIPCVWTFHDCHAFTGNCGYFFDCGRWREGCGGCPRLGGYPASLFLDFTAQMLRHKRELFTAGSKKIIACPSEWLTETAKQSFFGKYPCRTVRNGIDVHNVFYPRDRDACRAKYGFSPGEKLALGIAAGYKDPRKGAEYILQTARDLRGKAKVILIGWDRKKGAMASGPDNAVLLPPTESADMLAEYYSMADVFLLPSLAENYATSTLEAMACGTPVVGFAAGGTPEQLRGKRGIAVKAGSQEEFTAAVDSVLEGDCGLLQGEELARSIREENAAEVMVRQYRELYRELCCVTVQTGR